MAKAAVSKTSVKTKPIKKPAAKAQLPIWEKIQQRMNNVSAEELAQLPADGAAEHDHYLYGAPRRKKP